MRKVLAVPFGLLRNLPIATKVLGVVALLFMAGLFTAWSGIHAMTVYRDQVDRMQEAADRAIIGERVNGLVNAVVMDSRGIYLARSQAEVEKFGKPLLANLARIDSEMNRWRTLLPLDRTATLDTAQRQVADFVRLRTEMVQAARTSGGQAADAIGNNDANRANRQGLNETIVALAAGNAAEVQTLDDALGRFHTAMVTQLITVALGGMVTFMLLAVLVALGGITRPLSRIIGVTNRLASGVTDVVLHGHDRKDEIGQLARALGVFRDNMLETTRLQAAQKENAARAEAERRNTMLAMAADLEGKVGELVGMVSEAAAELSATAQSMSDTAAQSTERAAAVASAAEEAGASVHNVASAAEELASSISEITRQVTQSSRVTGQAVADAQRTDAVVRSLAQGAQNIGDVVQIINRIAGQTNLLALNATIEAARAGEAGRGFAVVASEVKGLAMQTGRATEDIARQVTQIQDATREAVTSIEAIGRTIDEVNQIATAIAAAVEQQGSATQEIARSVQHAAQGTQQVTANITGVSQGAARTGEAAHEVRHAAHELSGRATDLDREIGRFILGVRAA